jgi:hypothetical protein
VALVSHGWHVDIIASEELKSTVVEWSSRGLLRVTRWEDRMCTAHACVPTCVTGLLRPMYRVIMADTVEVRITDNEQATYRMEWRAKQAPATSFTIRDVLLDPQYNQTLCHTQTFQSGKSRVD